MLDRENAEFLRRAVLNNACVLYLGAGFSSAAENGLGQTLPLSGDLARAIWTWLGYERTIGPYDDTPLERLFDNATTERSDSAVMDFLRDRFLVKKYPPWYASILKPYWFRIYTTNVDDLIESMAQTSGGTRLDVVNGVRDRYRDRDRYLDSLQYIKLNGSVTYQSAAHLTFGIRKIMARSSQYDVWWDQFVRDYSQRTTILIGTRVNEPLFWRALEARGGRQGAAREQRNRSFLVAKPISPVLTRSLRDFNVDPVEATAEEFLTYLPTLLGDIESRDRVLLQVAPELAQYSLFGAGKPHEQDKLKNFFRVFTRVAVLDSPASHRSLFHHGAAPVWEDLALGLDARREITATVKQATEKSVGSAAEPNKIAVLGHRGAGKSTLLMRVALDLAARGELVFFASGESLADSLDALAAVELLQRRCTLVIDDGEWLTSRFAELDAAIDSLASRPTVLVGLRGSVSFVLDGLKGWQAHWIRELTAADIEAVIDVLEAANLLAGRTRKQMRDEFSLRARKQLLVAMKEVTSGRPFEDIIRREFSDIVDPELRCLYLVACLATAEDGSLTRGQLLASSTAVPAVVLSALERELAQIVVRTAIPDRWAARHPEIAETVLTQCVKHSELAEAYDRIVHTLANDMDSRAKAGEPKRCFRLYRRLVNHRELYERFGKDIDLARGVLQGVQEKVKEDPHYWLQYGSLELEYGELDHAAKYLEGAALLAPRDFMIRTSLAHLSYAEGLAAKTLAAANQKKAEAEAAIEELIDERGYDTSYPWHILLTNGVEWLEIWEPDLGRRKDELFRLRTRAAEACEARPHSQELREARERVERAYLQTAVKTGPAPKK
ncbi:MAG: ATP-binding protein [Gemmatimonadales bacterium]|jgi:hypothetical protein